MVHNPRIIRRMRTAKYAVALALHHQLKLPVKPWKRFPVRVGKMDYFNEIFRPGDRVLELHFAGGRKMIEGLDEALASVPALRKKGYAGYFGDTSVPSLIKRWKAAGAEIIQTPYPDESRGQRHYQRLVRFAGAPKEHLHAKMCRIVYRFPKE